MKAIDSVYVVRSCLFSDSYSLAQIVLSCLFFVVYSCLGLREDRNRKLFAYNIYGNTVPELQIQIHGLSYIVSHVLLGAYKYNSFAI